MGNTYFQFRQFKIDQDRCEMKVCTDSCILGAYASHDQPQCILDIGSGSGLIALMLAQRYLNARIDAIEIDLSASSQADENFRASPWNDRLKLFHLSLQEFKPRLKYDMIVTNPPFYQDHLKSLNSTRSGAKHQDWMSFSDLISFVGNHLQPDGSLWILYPPAAKNELQGQARAGGLNLAQELQIRHSLNSDIFRYVSRYSLSPKSSPDPIKDQIMIRSADNSYSVEMKRLLEPYYLEYNFI